MTYKVVLTEEKILEASWGLLGEIGIENFSMRKLAAQLDVKAASIYWHFKNQQCIFQALANHVSKEIVMTIHLEGNWQEQLFHIGNKFRENLKKYPCSAHIFMKTLPSEVNYVKLLNTMLKTIDHLKITDSQKFACIISFINYIISFEVDTYEQNQNNNLFHYDDTDETVQSLFQQALDKLEEEDCSIISRMYRNNVMKELQSDSLFKYGLDIIIKGIEELIIDN